MSSSLLLSSAIVGPSERTWKKPTSTVKRKEKKRKWFRSSYSNSDPDTPPFLGKKILSLFYGNLRKKNNQNSGGRVLEILFDIFMNNFTPMTLQSFMKKREYKENSQDVPVFYFLFIHESEYGATENKKYL